MELLWERGCVQGLWKAGHGYRVHNWDESGFVPTYNGEQINGPLGSLIAAQAKCQIHFEDTHCNQCFTSFGPSDNPEVRSCPKCGWVSYD